MIRELDLGTLVLHPEHLTPPDGDGITRTLFTSPVTWRLEHGAPDLGWEGDARLAIYSNPVINRWELWRLEHDNVYRIVMQSPYGQGMPTEETINQLIRRLIDHDVRRGFDPHLHVVKNDNAVRAAAKKAFRDRIENYVADKLHFAVSNAHLPGVDMTPRRAPEKRVKRESA